MRPYGLPTVHLPTVHLSIGARPAVVVVDVDGDEGLEQLEQLRAQALTKDTPIVVVSDGEDEAAIAQAFALGADDFVRKPLREVELTSRLWAHARLHESAMELVRKERDANVILELSQTLASSLDFREILFTVVRRIAEVVNVSRASIVLAPESEEGDVGYVVVASDDERLSNLQIDLAKYPEIQEVLRTGTILTVNDARTHPILDAVRDSVPADDVASMTLVPIKWQDQALGVLFLRAGSSRQHLTEREVHFCQIVANTTAVALRNARVMQSLRDHTQQVTFARFEAERRLRSFKRYADLFDSLSDGIAVIGQDGRLVFANPRAYELVGREQDTYQGRRVTELIHPEDREKARQSWDVFRGGNGHPEVDLRFLRPGGSTIVASVSASPLLRGEGAILVTFRDVTEQRHIAAELIRTKEFLESLIDASVDGIVAWDPSGTIILFNRGAEQLFGLAGEDVLHQSKVDALFPDDGFEHVSSMVQSPRHGGEGRLESTRLEALTADGVRVPISLSAAIIHLGDAPVATFGIFTDLRERLRVEERLAAAQQKLAVTEKQALIAELAGTAAHELNQPLTSVMGYAEILKRKLETGGAEHQAANIIVQECERMADIVRKIGKITKYETKGYVGQHRILDLDKASEEEPQGSVVGAHPKGAEEP